MTRQLRPFAIEIKRSRRSPPSASTASDLLERGRNLSESAAAQKTRATPELAVSTLHRSASGAHPPIPEREDCTFSSTAGLPMGNRTPRILPCLTPENADSAEPQEGARVAKKARPRKAFSSTAPKETRKGRGKKTPPQNPVTKSIQKTGKEPELMAPLSNAGVSAGKAALIDRPLRLTRARRFLELSRDEDTAILPRGQRWKRRLHPRV